MIIPFFVLPFFILTTSITDHSINDVRMLYIKSSTDERSCEKLIALLQTYDENNNSLLAGYKACATMMRANFKINPFVKLFNFSAGKNLLENCIEADPENIELRFLRLAVQNNVPEFLNYRNSIPDDKQLLLNSISTITDLQLKSIITTFLKNCNLLTQSEKQNLIK